MQTATDEGELQQLARQVFWGENVSIPMGDVELKATLHLPAKVENGAGCPAVVLTHGLGGNRNEMCGLFLKTAGALAMNGIAAIRFDQRGAGETGGNTREISLLRQIEDVSAVADYIKAHEAVDPNRLGLLGLSMGGLASACTAGRRDDIKALAIWEAPFDLHGTMIRLLGPLTVRSVHSTGWVQAGFIQIGVEFFKVSENFDTAANVSSYKNPVFLGYGWGDVIVTPDNAGLWQRAFSQNKTEVCMIPDADHAFSLDSWSWAVINKTVSWAKEHI